MIYKFFGVVIIILTIMIGAFCLKTLIGLVSSVITAPSSDSYLLGMLTFSLIVSLISGFLAYFLFKLGRKMFKGY